MLKYFILIFIIFSLVSNSFSQGKLNVGITPDYIYYNGKIITVDKSFTITEAVAIKEERFLAVGKNDKLLRMADSNTRKIDLKGKTVIPGIIEAHVHPENASTSELFEEIPDVHTVKELLDWIARETKKKKKGEWIIHPKLFPTRLKEMRQPTKDELDDVAPNNPVFLNGSYGGMINSFALKVSNITKDTEHKGILKDKVTGGLTGFIQSSAFELLKGLPILELSYEQELDALVDMIKKYNSVGITSFCSASEAPSNLKIYQDLYKQGRLSARVFQNIHVRKFGIGADDSIDRIRNKLSSLGYYTGFGNEWIRVGALKSHMDGGILTGTAYLREPWGNRAKDIYGITDPDYRGVLMLTEEQLVPLVTVANEIGWKFTAHCTGGGGVDVMLAAFEEVNKIKPIKERRFSIIHGNFFTPEAIKKMKKLGVCADMQPAWFYKDANAMKYVLGDKRIKTFHPYRSLFKAGVIVNGGSDHMVKFDSYTSINPYNPFLSMWSIITRKTERGSIINQEEAISREQALKMYTINNAYAHFEEEIKGSIEPGKLADMVIISDDILSCPVDNIKDIKAEVTILGGEVVYKR